MDDAPPDTGRNPDGTFKEGWKGGPGRPRGRMTWQDYADRIDYYMTEFSRSEIKAIVLDPAEFDKLVVRDAFIVQTIAEGLQVDGLASREKILSRVIGEAIKRGEISGVDGGKIDLGSLVTLKIDRA